MSDEAYLDAIAARSQTLEAQLRELAGSLTLAQLNWKPTPDRWSVAQCLDHILTGNRMYFDRMDDACASARTADPRSPFRPGPFGRRFAAMLGPTSERRFKAPALFAPSASEIPAAVVDELLAQQPELRAICERARLVDLTRTKVTSPVNRLLRFRLGDALMLIANHQERHVLQASRVTREAAFPAAE